MKRRVNSEETKRPNGCFVAIDFETANQGRDSACAVALVRVEGGEIVARERRLIRPPSDFFEFTHLHGIGWRDVAREPAFGDVWRDVHPICQGADFLAAHNASFDSGVLSACCARSDIKPPPTPFICTVALARRVWGIYPTKLPNVCRALRIPLNHHDPLSDAEACARIVMAAHRRE